MSIFTTQWIRNIFLPNAAKDKTCKESEECNRILQLILDGEASPQQEKHFFEHIDQCAFCYNGYKVEKSIRQLIKTKLKKETVPADLVESIRLKIQNNSV